MQNKRTSNLTPIRSGVNLAVAVLMVAGLSLATTSANAYVSKNDTVKANVAPYLLERENGVERVYASLEKQANQACSVRASRTLLAKQVSKACAANLLAQFVQDLDDARVTSYHVRAISK